MLKAEAISKEVNKLLIPLFNVKQYWLVSKKPIKNKKNATLFYIYKNISHINYSPCRN